MYSALFSFALVLASVDFIVVAFAVWWLRRGSHAYALKQLNSRQALEALRRLHNVANDVAGRVELHLSRVETISKELTSLRGACDSPQEQAVVDAVSRVVDVNRDMAAQLADAKLRLVEQAELIEAQSAAALADLVTGLPNRKGFDDELARRFAQWQDQDVPLSIVLIDIDNFQKLQETHGKEAADEVLRDVGQLLAETTRAVDLVARYGPEQFALLLPGTKLNPAKGAVERVRNAIASHPFAIGGSPVEITVSEGVSEAMPGDNVASLVKRTSTALEAARSAGMNRAHSHDGQRCVQIPMAPVDPPVDETADLERDLLRIAGKLKAEPADPHTDSLTGLLNRRSFFEGLRNRVAEHNLSNAPFCLALIEVDQMASLNKAHGHLVGDVILRVVAQILRTATRTHVDFAARYDETRLAVGLIATPLAEGQEVVERIRRAVASCKLRMAGEDLRITACIGLVEHVRGADSVALIKSAEAALKAARIGGRNYNRMPPISRPLVSGVPVPAA